MGAQTLGKSKGGGRRGRRARTARMSEINVTPFVDVMLVLLIIFMVAAPMLTVGVPVELPRTSAGALPAEQEEPLAITLTADGQVRLMDTQVAQEDTDLAPARRGVRAVQPQSVPARRRGHPVCAGRAGHGRAERRRVQRYRAGHGTGWSAI